MYSPDQLELVADAPTDAPTTVPAPYATRDEAWAAQHTYAGQPHGWVQWKGTDVCMDVHCKCGALVHVDGEFAYYVKCSGTVYHVNGHVQLLEMAAGADLSHEPLVAD